MPRKESSPELSTLAAEVLNDPNASQREKRLAASVLSNDETPGQAKRKRGNARGAEEAGKFTRSRDVMDNALVFSGTRIPVAAVKRFSEDGYSVEKIAREYPSLTKTDIEAALTAPEADFD